MTLVQLYKLEKGSPVLRKPEGYVCNVMAMDLARERVKIFDAHANSVFWCKFSTLLKDWKSCKP